MSFERIKTIKGRRYRYREFRTWENGRVRSRSEYLGPVREIQHTHDVAAREIERAAPQEAERAKQSKRAEEAKWKELHEKYGTVKGPSIPVPIEKPISDEAQKETPAEAGAAASPEVTQTSEI